MFEENDYFITLPVLDMRESPKEVTTFTTKWTRELRQRGLPENGGMKVSQMVFFDDELYHERKNYYGEGY